MAEINNQLQFTTVETVLRIVSNITGIPLKEIISTNRKRELVYIRAIICYYLKVRFNFTTTRIGKILEKNHATVIHGLKLHRNLLDIEAHDYTDIFFACKDALDTAFIGKNSKEIADTLDKIRSGEVTVLVQNLEKLDNRLQQLIIESNQVDKEITLIKEYIDGQIKKHSNDELKELQQIGVDERACSYADEDIYSRNK